MPTLLRMTVFVLGVVGSAFGTVEIGHADDAVLKTGAAVAVIGPEISLRSGNRTIPVGRDFRRFLVRRVDDGWVYLTSDRAAGWVRKEQAVPIEKAEEHLDGILERDPDLSWAKHWRAAARIENKQIDAALVDLDSLLSRDSTDVAALILRGRALTQKGDFDAAIVDLNKAIALAPSNARAFLARATSHQGKKQLEKADEDFSEALRLDPGDVEAWLTRGIVHRQRGQGDEAIADFNTAVNLAPNNGRAFLERGITRRDNGKLDWALADLAEAARLEPDSANAFLYLSVVRFMLRDFSGALDSAETSLKLAPADKEVLNHISWILATSPEARFRDGRRAVVYARKAEEVAGGEDPDVKDTLAAALAEEGLFDEALKTQARAIELYPMDDTDRPEAEKRLNLYKSRQAFRSDP